jgi:hypothetical protein
VSTYSPSPENRLTLPRLTSAFISILHDCCHDRIKGKYQEVNPSMEVRMRILVVVAIALSFAVVGFYSVGQAGETKAKTEELKGEIKSDAERTKGEAIGLKVEMKGNDDKADVERAKGKANAKGQKAKAKVKEEKARAQ